MEKKIYGIFDVEFRINPLGEYTKEKLIVGPFPTNQSVMRLFGAANSILPLHGKPSLAVTIEHRHLGPKRLDGDASMTGRELLEQAVHRYFERVHHATSIRQWIGLTESVLN